MFNIFTCNIDSHLNFKKIENYQNTKLDSLSPKISQKPHQYKDANLPIMRRKKQNDFKMYHFNAPTSATKELHSDVYLSVAQRESEKLQNSTRGNFNLIIFQFQQSRKCLSLYIQWDLKMTGLKKLSFMQTVGL